MLNAFEYLSDLEKRCQHKAVGLPAKADVEEVWVGIGFSVSKVECIAKMTEVNEILPVPEMIRVPGVKTWVKGVANIRGSLMPILDMRGFFSGETTVIDKRSRILIVNMSGVLAGLLVEEVFGLRRFKEVDKGEQESLNGTHMGQYINGAFLEKNRRWNIFSMQKLLTTEKFLRVVY